MDLDTCERSWKLFSSPHSADTMTVYFREVCGETVIFIRTRTNDNSTAAIPRGEAELEIREELFPAFNIAAELVIKHLRNSPNHCGSEVQHEILVCSYGSEKALLVDRHKRSFLIRYCPNLLPIKTLNSTSGLHIIEKEFHFPVKICLDVNDTHKFTQLLAYVRETLSHLRRKRLIGEPFSLFPPSGYPDPLGPPQFDGGGGGGGEGGGKDEDVI